MADKCTYSMLEVVVGQLCLHTGFHKCKRTALEVITDVLYNYLRELLIRISTYTELACRTEPTLRDVLLAFKDFDISIDDLHEYVKLFGEVPPAIPVPKYPIPREHNYNILQPGSCELVPRSLYVEEHSPLVKCSNLVTDPQVCSNLVSLSHSSNNLNTDVEKDINEISVKENLCKILNKRSVNDCTVTKDSLTKESTSDRTLREIKRFVIKKVDSSSSYVVVNPELLPEKVVTNGSTLTSPTGFDSEKKRKKRKKKKHRKDVSCFEEDHKKHKHKKAKKKKAKKSEVSFQTDSELARL